MKIVNNPRTYSGEQVNKDDYHRIFNILVPYGKKVTNIYIKDGEELFSIWLEDCPKINSDREVWNVLTNLDTATFDQAIKAICISQYVKGLKDGKVELQNKLKDLLDIEN